MISIYSAMFNVCKFSFNYEKNIKNWCNFVGPDGEVIITCNTSEDNSYEELCNLRENSNLKQLIIYKTEIPYTNRFDGKIKTEALKHCSEPIRILMDADEYIPLGQKELWNEWADFLIEHRDKIDGLLIPTIDLYGSTQTIRKNNNIGQKFRIHTDKIKARGVIKSAELPGGFFRTDLSDNTEPLLENNELGRFYSIIQNSDDLKPENSKKLLVYTVHEGYLDLQRKANHGKLFWKEAWENYSNKSENVATDISQLENEEVTKHNLDI